jgi:hypothetical protein
MVCSRSLEEACDLIQNIAVRLSIGIVEAWSVNKCKDTAIGCGPVIETDLRRLGPDSMSDFDYWVFGDELDELFVE